MFVDLKVSLKAAALATIALAGCVSPEERHERDVATCTSYGFHHQQGDANDAAAFANCMMTLDQNRQAATRAALQNVSEDLQRQGEQLQMQGQIQMLGAQIMAPRP
jgi:hypothetical protein